MSSYLKTDQLPKINKEKKVPFGMRKNKGNFGKKPSKQTKENKPKSIKKTKLKSALKVPKNGIMDKEKTVRFNKAELNKRVRFVSEIGACQVCGTSSDLDYPHHALSGIYKDDRTLICICRKCHYEVHFGSWDNLEKTREELVAIGWSNNDEYLEKDD